MIRDLMTTDLVTCAPSDPVTEAARLMREHDVGDVLVEQDGRLVGIVTDRDIVVRGVAHRTDLDTLTVGDVCTPDPHAVAADADIGDVLSVMEEHALRRVPVVDGDRAVGIVSIGDLAERREPDSALGQISSAPPNV